VKAGSNRVRHLGDRLMQGIGIVVTIGALAALAALLYDVGHDGLARLSWQFLTSYPSRHPEQAGILAALVGSVYVILLTAVLAVPIGVGAAIYLEEYAGRTRLSRIIEINIANLAGVPSIVYGILGLAMFVRYMVLGRSILAAALTLALLILPVVIIASQEAIKAVPNSIRLGAYALGATRWEAIRYHVFPLALPGILTGTILALSRAVGEAAPLIVVGALAFVPFVPSGPLDQFTVLPIQIFNWINEARVEFHYVAASAILVLLVVLLTMNGLAILLRNRYSRRN
jgi:phosphate transport system permease protein